ncbi:MAG: hypothetical protein V4488_23245 [Pseudomonadota bacterium]
MSKQSRGKRNQKPPYKPHHKQEQDNASRAEDVNEQRQRAEASEVTGRHMNEGPKDHQGARKN